jgi:hypothetical protein
MFLLLPLQLLLLLGLLYHGWNLLLCCSKLHQPSLCCTPTQRRPGDTISMLYLVMTREEHHCPCRTPAAASLGCSQAASSSWSTDKANR